MQAITTKYLSATNTKPSRIKAECEAGSLTLPFSVCDEVGELRGETPDQRCAYALMRKLGWDNDLASGTVKDGTGVHVLVPATQVDGGSDGIGIKDGIWHFPGMTLRDYFAASAMVAFIPIAMNDHSPPSVARSVAETAYHMADEMLKAREQK